MQSVREFFRDKALGYAGISGRRSALAARAIDTGALSQLEFTQGAAAVFAKLAAAPVDEQLLLEIARLAVTADEVTQGGAAALDGMGEDAFDLLGQGHVARPGNRTGLAARIDASGEQRFARIDIADPDHHGVVHDEGFDRHRTATRLLVQALAVERLGQGFGTELAEQHMVPGIGTPEQRAEAPWIGVAQGQAGLQLDVHMLVLGRRQATLDQAQVAGHAQVTDQTAGLGLNQQVFGAPLDTLDALAGQAHIQVFGNRPAQTTLAHNHSANPLTFEKGRDTAAGGFDFRQFGHGQSFGQTGEWQASTLAGNRPYPGVRHVGEQSAVGKYRARSPGSVRRAKPSPCAPNQPDRAGLARSDQASTSAIAL